jgi:nickel-dependent lactate racemase
VRARSPRDVTIFVATGTHRTDTDDELEAMLGAEVMSSCSVVQNNAGQEAIHVAVGRTASGNDIRILRSFMHCDVKVLTGFIEPHFFAGFSGGGKAVMPGLAALETVMRNHSVVNIDDPRATWGVTWGNPIWEEAREAASLARPDFVVNVALNREKAITHVFAGAFPSAHDAGCDVVKERAMVPVEKPFDVVVTSNSGYPLDLNLYQSVKGMSAAAQIVKPGGHIICAAECWDGVPEHGSFGTLLQQATDPAQLLRMLRAPDYVAQDMWQAQILALICERATVHIYSDGLTDEQIRRAMLTPCRSIEDTLTTIGNQAGQTVRCCVLPEGPVTIPYVKE